MSVWIRDYSSLSLSLSLLATAALPAAQTQLPGPPCPLVVNANNDYYSSTYFPDPLNQELNGTVIRIKAGDTVYFNASTPAMGEFKLIWIQGRLIFDPCFGDLELRAASILVDDGGAFQIGSGTFDHPNQATVILNLQASPPTGADWSTGNLIDIDSTYHAPLEDRGFVVAGGALRLFGKSKGVSWEKLDGTVQAASITMPEPLGSAWVVDDEILLTPTDFDHLGGEVRTLNSGAPLIWTTGLANLHYADAIAQDFTPVGGTGDWSLSEQGEVANLTRNIVIRGEDDDSDNFGHIIFIESVSAMPKKPIVRVNWAQFKDLGNAGALGRYPFHLHQAEDLLADPLNPPSFIKNSVIRESANKGIVVHNTENFEVHRNVIHNHAEYGIYLEGDSGNNVVTENLSHGGVKANDCCLFGRVSAGLTMRHPNNAVERNVATGYHDYGFYLLPSEVSVATSSIPFKGNEAHSINTIGIFQNVNAITPNIVYEEILAWKCRRFGAWIRSLRNYTVKNSKFADCRGGFYPASTGIRNAGEGHQLVDNCLFIGESLNVGPPTTGVAWEQAALRSLPQQVRGPDFEPKHDLEWDVLCGIEVYDGFVEIKDCRFAEFEDDSWGTEGDRRAAALTQVAKYTTWSVDPRNSVEGLEFGGSVDRKAYFRDALDGENQISFTSIVDIDNSLGYGANTRLFPNEDILSEANGLVLNPDSLATPGLNGYAESLNDTSWGQILFEPIPANPFSSSDLPTIKVERVLDPLAASPSTSGYPYFSKTVPLSPLEGGNGKPRYPLNLPIQSVNDIGLAAKGRYFRVSYDFDWPILDPVPADFSLSLRFTNDVWDAVFFEIPMPASSSPSVQEGVLALTLAPDLQTLLMSTSQLSEWYWDSTNNVIVIRVVSDLNPGQSLALEGTETIISVSG